MEANLFSCELTVLHQLEYPGKIQKQDKPESFFDYSTKMSIRHNVLIDLDKLSSDYSWNICFSCLLPHTDAQSFSHYKPLKNVQF